VTAYQLAYQSVHGVGPVERTFTENSVMGRQILQDELIQSKIAEANARAQAGNYKAVEFYHSLAAPGLLAPVKYGLYDFPSDALGRNPARAYQGSFGGTVTPLFGGGVRVQIRDVMDATSGSRASGTVGGYDKNDPSAVFPTANPYGTSEGSPWRTIVVHYDLYVK
jgi:hypothetical protein